METESRLVLSPQSLVLSTARGTSNDDPYRHATGIDGADRLARQAAGDHLSGERHLRRLRQLMGLRAARRPDREQCQGGVVEGDGATARRHGRPRRRHPHVAAGLGGVRPCRPLHGPARRLHDLQTPLPRRSRRADAVRQPRMAQGGSDGSDLPRRQDRGAAVQYDVQDLRRPAGGERVRRLPAAGDGAGHLRQLPQCARHEPQEAALRHRADRQVVPQRDHARQLHLPHARVRADGDGVLRHARHRA